MILAKIKKDQFSVLDNNNYEVIYLFTLSNYALFYTCLIYVKCIKIVLFYKRTFALSGFVNCIFYIVQKIKKLKNVFAICCYYKPWHYSIIYYK